MQSALTLHSTQTPPLQTPPPIWHWALLVQPTVQVCEPRSHFGIPPEHWASLVQSTHSPVPVSQTCICGAQSAGLVHPVQTPLVVSQKGVAPPHCASLVHEVDPPELLVALGPPLLVALGPLLLAVVVAPPGPVVPLVLLEIVERPPVPLEPPAVLLTLPPHAAAAALPSAKRMIKRFIGASSVRTERAIVRVVSTSASSPSKQGTAAAGRRRRGPRPAASFLFAPPLREGWGTFTTKDELWERTLKVGGRSRKGRATVRPGIDMERWRARRGFAAALGLAPGLLATSARTDPGCEQARIVLEGVEPSPSWRRAYDDLVASTSVDGHLWSCAGGELHVTITADGIAILRRRDLRGREAVRRAPGPDDLAATAEALLALPPAPPEPPPLRPVAGPAPAPSAPPAPTAPVPQDPRLVAEATLAARFGGTTRAVWGAGTLRIAVPLGAWSVAAWARYGIPYVLDPTPADFSMSDIAFGLSLGRRIVAAGAFELHATFDPSVGFVSMEGGVEPMLAQGAQVDMRLGLGLRGVMRWTRMWRGVVALDGEVAPASVAKARRIDPSLPPLPAYSMGASIGVGAAFR
jgi:hypothetical protein